MQSRLNKNPGPGTYPSRSELGHSSFSLRGKNYQEDHEKLKIPGPGKCTFLPNLDPVTFGMSEKGQYFLSKYKNSCTRGFSGLTARSKVTPDNKIPGPGFYDCKKTDLSPEGRYFVSKMPSSLVRKFGSSDRSNIARSTETPGPGNYRIPSEFGYYASKDSIKKPATEGGARKK